MENRSIDKSIFTKFADLPKTEGSWNSSWNAPQWSRKVKNYTIKEIQAILNSPSLSAQQELSRTYYEKDGLYKKIILYYATLLSYTGLLIPCPGFGKQLSSNFIQKRYHAAMTYLNGIDCASLMTRMSKRALVDGSYYGVIQTLDKNNFVLFDLPTQYSRSRFRDVYGNDIVEFNVEYFNTIIDEAIRKEALDTYPKVISSYYYKYMKGKKSTSWVALPAKIGICFSFFEDNRPLLLNVIPATLQYDEAVETEQERALEEIRKIIVQKVPHLNDGQLLFEPDEALEMHKGSVNMLRGNKNLSVLTTYTDVDAIVSRTTADNAATSLEKMLQNVYAEAGVSGQIFAPTGAQSVSISIRNDIALMMILANKYASFLTYILNSLFANANVSFKYTILPVGVLNQSEYLADALKMAQNGYSFLLASAAMNLNQADLINIKDLENNILNLKEVLIPLSSSYTESGDSDNKVGAPEKPLELKADKTIQNEDALDHQGGSE